MAKVRISDLPALTTGSTETQLVGNFQGTTYRISLSTLTASVVAMLSESLDGRLDLLENFENNFNTLSASFSNRIEIATNETIFVTTSSFNSFTQSQNTLNATWATTGSNTFNGNQIISGSIIPSVGVGESTSSFSLGSPDAAWKDIYVSRGTIHFLDETGSVVDTIAAVSGGIVVSNLLVDGGMTGSLDYINLINTPEFPTTGSNTYYGNQKVYGAMEVSVMMNPQELIQPTIIPSGYNALLIGPVGTNTEIIVQDNALLVIL